MKDDEAVNLTGEEGSDQDLNFRKAESLLFKEKEPHAEGGELPAAGAGGARCKTSLSLKLDLTSLSQICLKIGEEIKCVSSNIQEKKQLKMNKIY